MEQENNQVYRAVFDGAPDAMALVDSSGNIRLLNRKMLEITGYPDEGSLCGENFAHIITGAEREKFVGYLQDTRSPDMTGIREFGILRKDGSVAAGELLLGTVPGDAAGPGMVIITIRDVSEGARSRKALDAVVRLLNRFNSVNRHDIMNQLTILLGYLELSHDMVTDDTLKEFISREEGAAEAIRRQVAFTKDYQDIGVNVPAWIDLPKIIRETASIIDHPALKVEVSVDPGLRVFADPLIRKIVSNFIENTVLYGKTADAIAISAREQPGGLVIAFSDNGAGVPAEDKERIFTRGFGSKRGYGLYLAREILAITDITIAETGEPGKGARFEITVPQGGYRFG